MENRIFSVNADSEGILILEDSPTQENVAMSEKLVSYTLNVNGDEFDIKHDKITAGALKEKLNYPSHFWVAIIPRRGGTADFIDDHEEIVVNDVEVVSIITPAGGGLHMPPPLPYTEQNPELRRLYGRLMMEIAFLQRVKMYGNVTFKIVGDGSEAFVFVPELQIGKQWNIPVVDIFIQIPTHSPCYPTHKLDDFFVSKDLRTHDGQKPANLWHTDRFSEDGYAKFSFHVKEWRPIHDPRQFTSGDCLVSYLNSISVLFHLPAKVR